MRLGPLSCLLAGLTAVNALPTISVKGSKFFDSNGIQFFLKGIAYQLVPDDPLIDTAQCKRDAALKEKLGANSIRVYHVDPDSDHKGCMDAFAGAGIYLWVDLDTFNTQIEETVPHWNETQVKAFEAVMDEFQKYNNTAGFFVGNEVLTKGNYSFAAPFVKAAARDMKAYRDKKGYRNIPIGYSAADIASTRPMLQNYMACGTNASESLDFFGLNAYEWCGKSNYQQSGYADLTRNATSYNIPIFLSETGCREPRPRTFDDQAAIFGDQMAPYWSGSIVYEWIEEANNYGLIKYGEKVDPSDPDAPPDGFTRSGTPTPISPDFDNLSKHWATLTPKAMKEKEYTPTLTPPPCPAYTASFWEVNGAVALPSIGQTFDSAVKSSITAGTAATTGTAATATPTKGGAASPAKEVKGMGLGLLGVLLTFFWWM